MHHRPCPAPDITPGASWCRSRFPAAPLCASGYSLGSVVLSKYLAEADSGQRGRPDGSGLVAACLVSNPVCLEGSGAQLSRPWRFSYIYNLALAHK
jgi:predicted alpha/beta-fold hydrolase